MSSRLVHRKRWQDKWYLKISNNAKLLYDYIGDHCDNAGVYEWNEPLICFSLKINKTELDKLFKEIKSKVIVSKDKELVFIKTFLYHQRKIPLRPRSNSHREVIKILLRVLPRFSNDSGIIDLIPPEYIGESGSTLLLKHDKELSAEERFHTIISKNAEYHETSEDRLKDKSKNGLPPSEDFSNNTAKFEPPTLQEVTDYMIQQALKKGLREDEYNYELMAENCFTHYDDLNWRVSGGKRKVKSWKSIVTRWLNNNIKGGNFYNPNSHNDPNAQKNAFNGEKKSRIHEIKESTVSDKRDWNE